MGPAVLRGVPAKPKDSPRVPIQTWWEEAEAGTERLAQGKAYVDGSFRGIHWKASRSAWAAVSLCKEGG